MVIISIQFVVTSVFVPKRVSPLFNILGFIRGPLGTQSHCFPPRLTFSPHPLVFLYLHLDHLGSMLKSSSFQYSPNSSSSPRWYFLTNRIFSEQLISKVWCHHMFLPIKFMSVSLAILCTVKQLAQRLRKYWEKIDSKKTWRQTVGATTVSNPAFPMKAWFQSGIKIIMHHSWLT